MYVLKAVIDFLITLLEGDKPDPIKADSNAEKRQYGTLTAFPKKSNIQYSNNFNSNEFDCKCKGLCDETHLDTRVPVLLQNVRDELGSAVIITSAYRCEQHNANVGGSPTSTHKEGIAVDVWCEDMDKLVEIVEKINPKYSIGRYNTFTHIDLREDGRRWDFRR